MKLEFAQSVVDFMYDSGTDAKLYEDYSGRWMYGSTTAAVVGDLSEVLMAIGYLCGEKGSNLPPDVRYDNMGRSDMVVY